MFFEENETVYTQRLILFTRVSSVATTRTRTRNSEEHIAERMDEKRS